MKIFKPLVKITLLFLGGIFLGRVFHLSPGESRWLFLGAGAILLAAGLIRWKFRGAGSRYFFLAAVGILCLAGGAFRCSLATVPPPHHLINYISSSPIEITGRVCSEPVRSRHSIRFLLRCRELKTNNSPQRVEGLLDVIFHGPVRTANPIIQYGNLLQIKSLIRLPEERGNPGEVSARKRLADRGIYLQTRLYHTYQLILVKKCPPLSPLGLALRLRHLFQRSIARSLPDRYDRPGSLESVILGGLLLGDKSQIPYQIRDNFRRVGAIHILVVSGLHVGFIWLLVNLLFCWVPLRWRQLIIIPVIVLYVLMTGGRNPTVRAGLIAIIFCLSFLFNQPRNLWTALAAAALLLVLYNPLNLFQAGFQLSFLIVVSIIALYPLLDRWLRFLPEKIRPFLIVPLSAQLGAFPLIGYYFHFASPLAFLGNLIVIPLAWIIVSLGLIAGSIGLVSPLTALLLNYPNRVFIYLLLKTVGFLAHLPFSSLHLRAFPIGLILLWYLVLLIVTHWDYWRLRWMDLAAGGVLIVLGAAGLSLLAPPRPPLRAIFFNGESGGFTWLQTAGGKTILIAPDDDPFKEIPSIIHPYLFQEGINKIDYLILTGAGTDHLNTLRSLLKLTRIGAVLDHPGAPASPSYPWFKETVKKQRLGYEILKPGREININGLKLTLLSGEDSPEAVIWRLTFGEVSFLFPGSIGRAGEEDLLRLHPRIPATVLKVPRGGSRTHNLPDFLRAVRPRYALLIQGQKYFGRHPADCSALLKELRAEVHKTSSEGALIVETDGRTCRIISNLNTKSYDQ